jgi:hypothetical protein
MNEIKLIYSAVVIALFLLIFINLAVVVYVGFFKLDEMESHLKNCYLIQANKQEASDSFLSRRYRLNLITAMLRKQPSTFLLNDPKAIEDIRQFPLLLRRWIEIPHRMSKFSLIGLLVVWGWGEYIGF